jgi:hypothetical protein
MNALGICLQEHEHLKPSAPTSSQNVAIFAVPNVPRTQFLGIHPFLKVTFKIFQNASLNGIL